MHRTSTRALRAAAWIALASAAAATPAIAAAADIYLKLGSIKGESAASGARDTRARQIEIESFSWGATQAVYAHGTGGNMAAGRVNKIDAFTIKQTVRTDDVGEDRVAAADLDRDGRPDVAKTVDKATPKLAEALTASGSRTAGGSTAATQDVVSPRDSASGMPTGKRQHGWVTVSRPMERGSLSVRGSFPGCRVGDAYGDAVLQTATMRYELKEVIITSCPVSASGGGGGGGGAMPMESISLNYAKVQVRGWNPETKEH